MSRGRGDIPDQQNEESDQQRWRCAEQPSRRSRRGGAPTIQRHPFAYATDLARPRVRSHIGSHGGKPAPEGGRVFSCRSCYAHEHPFCHSYTGGETRTWTTANSTDLGGL